MQKPCFTSYSVCYITVYYIIYYIYCEIKYSTKKYCNNLEKFFLFSKNYWRSKYCWMKLIPWLSHWNLLMKIIHDFSLEEKRWRYSCNCWCITFLAVNTCTACYVIFVEWNVCTHLMPNNRKVRVILWVKDLELHSLYHTFILITHLVLLFYSFNWSGFKRKWRSSLLILEWLSSAATFFVIWWPKISIFLPLQKSFLSSSLIDDQHDDEFFMQI